jgi:hypothetical protein
MLNAVQGQQEQATQITIVGALLDRVLRRHQFVADAVVRQIRSEGS